MNAGEGMVDEQRVARRARVLLHQHRRAIFRHTDRVFAALMIVQWLAGIAAALLISPHAWTGSAVDAHVHLWAALALGGTITALPVFLALRLPGAAVTRHVIAAGQMLMGALLIDLGGGRIETHFHIFGSLAFLAFYRDWRVLITASAVVTLDHLLRGMWWPMSVYGVPAASHWRWLEHAAWVIFEDVFLIRSCVQSIREMQAIAERQAELEISNARIEAQVVQRTSELRDSERQTRQILDAIGDMVFVKNEQGQIIWANSAFREYFGIAADQVMPLTRAPLTTPQMARERRDADARVFATGRRLEIPAEPVVRREGQVRMFHTVKAPIFDAQGKVRLLVAVSRDITQRLELERSIVESQRFLQSTLDSLSSHIAILAEDGRIIAVNAAWRRFGAENGWQTPQSGVGLNYLDVCNRAATTDQDAAAAARGIREVLGGQRQEFTLEYPCHSPSVSRWFVVRVTRFTDMQADRVRAVVAHLDITGRKRAELAERERRSLSEAVAAMEQVLGVVGHELRTPLAGLRAMSEFLLAEDLESLGASGDFVRKINEEVVRLSEMVNNMLEAARLKSGAARWNWSTLAVKAACEEAVAIVRPLADVTHIDMGCNVEPPDLQMQGDADAVHRLVLNLLRNAQKHTCCGHILVRAGEVFDAAGRCVEIVVEDTGEGIAPQIAEKLGEAFALNAGVVGAANVGGSGLGLAICKGIVAAHGGSMSIQSERGRGTTVRAILRADLPQPATHSDIGILKEIAA